MCLLTGSLWGRPMWGTYWVWDARLDWWNTLHQGASVSRLGGSTIHPAILVPLIVMLIAFTLLFVALQLASMRPLFPCGSEAASRPLDGRSAPVRPTMFHPASRRGSACDRADSP